LETFNGLLAFANILNDGYSLSYSTPPDSLILEVFLVLEGEPEDITS
jgi:hypothetical protein